MKKINIFSLLVIFIGFFWACSDDDNFNYIANRDILSYSIREHKAEVSICSEYKNVYIVLPESVTDGEGLSPEFELSKGAFMTLDGELQVSGVSRVDFSSVVEYMVTSGVDSLKTPWRVSVTNNSYTLDWGLGRFLLAAKSNEGTRESGWYQQQQHTGEYASQNCGPAAATMAACWADAAFSKSIEEARNTFPVSSVKDEVSWHPEDVCNYLTQNDIPAKLEIMGFAATGAEKQFGTLVRERVNEGHIVVICLKLDKITRDESGDPECRANLYYNGTGGHFLVIKGYRIVDEQMYCEVQDPWGLDLKYSDGTYKGANRYYLADDLYAASISHNKKLVIVSMK